jgi:serine protease Do
MAVRKTSGWLWLVMVLMTAWPAVGHARSNLGDDFPAIVQKVRDSIVGIGTYQALRRPPVSLSATGFVVHDGTYVVTNYHAIPPSVATEEREKLVAIVAHGRRYKDRPAEIVALDADHDLALLKIKGDPLPALTLGSGALVPDGTSIAVTGFPIGSILGIYPVTHVGIVSAITPIRVPQPNAQLLDSQMILRNPFDVYQLDLTAFPGNSGSPLYDARTGKVVGILNSTFVKETKERALTDPTGISFAIPVIYIHEILKKIDK